MWCFSYELRASTCCSWCITRWHHCEVNPEIKRMTCWKLKLFLEQKRHSEKEKKDKRKNNFLLSKKALRIYSLSFSVYHTALLTVVIMLYITSLVLNCFVTASLYLLTTILHFFLFLSSSSGNHKFDFFFYDFGLFVIVLVVYFRLHI